VKVENDQKWIVFVLASERETRKYEVEEADSEWIQIDRHRGQLGTSKSSYTGGSLSGFSSEPTTSEVLAGPPYPPKSSTFERQAEPKRLVAEPPTITPHIEPALASPQAFDEEKSSGRKGGFLKQILTGRKRNFDDITATLSPKADSPARGGEMRESLVFNVPPLQRTVSSGAFSGTRLETPPPTAGRERHDEIRADAGDQNITVGAAVETVANLSALKNPDEELVSPGDHSGTDSTASSYSESETEDESDISEDPPDLPSPTSSPRSMHSNESGDDGDRLRPRQLSPVVETEEPFTPASHHEKQAEEKRPAPSGMASNGKDKSSKHIAKQVSLQVTEIVPAVQKSISRPNSERGGKAEVTKQTRSEAPAPSPPTPWSTLLFEDLPFGPDVPAVRFSPGLRN